MKRLNIKLLVILGVLFVGGGIGTKLLHDYQVAKTADTKLIRANEARDAGDPVEEYKQLRRYLQHRPEDTETFKRYLICLKDNLFSGRIPVEPMEVARLVNGLTSAIRNNPDDIELRQLSIDYWVAADNPTGAVENLEKLESLGALRTQDIQTWAKLDQKLGNVDAAMKRLATLIDFDLATEQFIEDQDDTSSADANTAEGETSQKESYKDLLTYRMLADFYLKQRATTEGFEIPTRIMDKMVERNPNNAKAYLERARYSRMIAEGAQKSRAGLADIDKALELGRDDPEIIAQAAFVLIASREFDRAQQILDSALQKFPDDWRVYRNLSLLYRRQNNPLKAVEILNEGLEREKLKLHVELLYSRCEAFLEANDVKQAEETYDLVVQNKKVPQFHKDLLRARILMAKDKIVDATKLLRRLRPNAPEQFASQVIALLQTCYARSGQTYLANELRQEQAKNNAVQAKLTRAQDLVRRSQYREALAIYEELIREFDAFKNPDGWQKQLLEQYIAAIIDYQNTRPEDQRNWAQVDKLASLYLRAVQASPDEVEIFNIKLLNSKGKRREARRLAEINALKRPRDVRFWMFYLQLTNDNELALNIIRRMEENLGDQFYLRVAKAERLAQMNRPDAVQQIEALLQGIDKFKPDEQEMIRQSVASQLASVGAYDASLAIFDQLLAEKGNDIRMLRRIFDVALEADNSDKINETIERIGQSIGKDSAEFLVFRARKTLWDIRKGKADRSELANVHSDLDTAQARQEGWDMIHAVRGEAFEVEQKIRDAITEYRRAYDINPTNTKHISTLSRILTMVGDYDSARTLLAKLPDSAKNDTQIREEILLLAQKDPKAALERAKSIIDSKTKNPNDLLFLAQLSYGAGNKNAARAAYSRATEVAPTDPRTWREYMKFLVVEKDVKTAESVVKKIQVSGMEPQPMALLIGQSYAMLKQFDKAKQYYREAHRLTPTDTVVMRNILNLAIAEGDTVLRDEFLDKLIAVESSKLVDTINIQWARRMKAQLLAASQTYPDFQKAVALIEQNRNEFGKLIGEDLLIWLELHANRPEPDSRAKASAKLAEIRNERSLSLRERLIQARLQKASGNWEDARSTMQSLVSQSQNDPYVLTTFIEWLLERGDSKSLSDAASLVRSLPDSSTDKLRLTTLLLVKQGRPEVAYRELMKLIPKDLPKSQSIKIREVARMMNQLGNYDPKFYGSAKKLWQRYLATLEEPFAELPLYASFLMDIPDNEQTVDKNLRYAFTQCNKFVKREIAQQNWDRVLQYVAIGIEGLRKHQAQITPDSPYFKAVQQWLDAAVAANVNQEDTLIQQAFLSDLQQDYDRVEKSYRAYLQLPTAMEYNKGIVRNNLAYLLATTGRPDEALRVLNEAIASLGIRSDLRDTRAVAYIALQRYDEAIKDLDVIEQSGDASPMTFFHRAYAKLRSGDRDGAKTDMNRALELGLNEADLTPPEKKFYDELISSLGITHPSESEVSANG